MEEELLRKALREEIHQKALELVDRKTKEIHKENIELLDNQHLLGKDLEELGQEKENLEMQNKKLAIERKIADENLKVYAKQTIKLTNEIKELQKKVETLEIALNLQTKNFENEKQSIIQKHDEILEKLRKKLSEAKLLHKTRTRELLNLKNIAEKVVEQRTELEIFFTEAFSYVKEQRLKEKKQNEDIIPLSFHNLNAFPGREFPPIHIKSSKLKDNKPNHSESMVTKVREANYSPQVTLNGHSDFTSLTWEDKEKVLKLLFEKINRIHVHKKQSPAKQAHLSTPIE
jgi:DNA repair exonuclease SbcCD ATPase subunit